jgi:ABC-type spermidine/putrescine transport system permease subunit II
MYERASPSATPLQIWGLLRRGITPEVNAAATIIFLVSVLVIVVWARLMREPDRA